MSVCRTATVRCLEPTRLFCIGKADFVKASEVQLKPDALHSATTTAHRKGIKVVDGHKSINQYSIIKKLGNVSAAVDTFARDLSAWRGGC